MDLLEACKREEGDQSQPDSSQELDDFISAQRSANTVKKTNNEWKKFENFCKEETSGTFDVEHIPADALDKLLAKFFKDIRKQHGEEYEPDTLSGFKRSIQRRLKELKIPFNILQEEAFRCSREVLATKRKNLVKQGRGNKEGDTGGL